MIASTQTASTGVFTFIVVPVFKLLRRKVSFINRNDNRNSEKVGYLFKIANFTDKLLQMYKYLEMEIFTILLTHLSDYLSVLIQFAGLYL